MPLPAALLPAIIAGAGAAVGGIASAGINAASSRARAREANELNLAMWDKANAYNSASSVMARARAAGLNPQMAGLSAVGNPAASSPTLSSGDSLNLSNFGSDAVSAVSTAMQLEQMRANIDLTVQETRLKQQQADAYETGDYYGAQTQSLWSKVALQEANIERIGVDIDYRRAQTDKVFSDIMLQSQQMRNIDSQIGYRGVQSSALLANISRTKAMTLNILDQIDYRKVQREYTKSMIQVNAGRMTLMEAQERSLYAGINSSVINNYVNSMKYTQMVQGKGMYSGPLAPLLQIVYGVGNTFSSRSPHGNIQVPYPQSGLIPQSYNIRTKF